jgi:hypothetical protein
VAQVTPCPQADHCSGGSTTEPGNDRSEPGGVAAAVAVEVAVSGADVVHPTATTRAMTAQSARHRETPR